MEVFMCANIKVKNFKLLIMLMVLLQIVEQTAISFYPYSLYYIIDNFSLLNREKITRLIFLFFLSVFLLMICNYLFKVLNNRFNYNICFAVRKTAFEKISLKNFKDYHKHSFDYYSSFLVNDVDKLVFYYYSSLLTLWCKVKIIVPFIIVAFLSWQLFCVLFVSSLVIIIVPKLIGRRYEVLQNKVSESNASYLERINELLNAHDFITHNGQKHFFRLHSDSLKNKEDALLKYNDYECKIEYITGNLFYIQQFVIFALGLMFVFKGSVTLGILSSVMIFTDTVVLGICNVVELLLDIKSSQAYKKKTEDMVNNQSGEITEQYVGKRLNELSAIVLDNISVDISDSFALRNISLRIVAGGKYLIEGSNGSGKTSLLNVIMSFFPVSSGRIEYVGLEPNESINLYVSFVPQKRFIFQGSIYENVTLFDEKSASRELVEKIMKDLHLNRNSDDQVGRNGEFLSGGEVAKISIIRALISNRNYLFLDEPFNDIDDQSRDDIIDYLMSSDKTIVMVSHNLNEDIKRRFDSIFMVSDSQVSLLK